MSESRGLAQGVAALEASTGQCQNSFQRNAHPIGTIVEFVAQSIDGLFQQIHFEQHGARLETLWQQIAFTQNVEIRLQENRANPLVPIPRPRLEFRKLWSLESPTLELLDQRCMSGIIKGTQHPRDVA